MQPGSRVTVNESPAGWMSSSRSNWLRSLLRQTCTGPADSPPVTWKLSDCGFLASPVSMMTL
jgi:hypothetical protein